MIFALGITIMLSSIILGFIGEGGKISILFQPYSVMIIVGSGIGIFIISNPKSILKSIWINLPKMRKEQPFKRQDYISLLCFLYSFFQYTKGKTMSEIERHIESPFTSELFKQYPVMLSNREASIFFCDHMRLFLMEYDNIHEMENMMYEQIQLRKNYTYEISASIYRLADTLPALGIVAAVLGVINAMSSINSPAAVLGSKIASALIGTFFGIAAAYCVVTPIAAFLEKYGNDEAKFLECVKGGLIAFAKGAPPIIAVEFARQAIPISLKPSYQELEKSLDNRKPIGGANYGRTTR